ncbi:hypothetical protein GYMLUDRAFT_60002 [Collybiopsis luxurians FD-317 M1]|uniref:Unplaced genomic scaffold GYMLUscaffold_30, whole genome shotgun sequence n=1 Tax=Collybiopsis luxurians FD-317 M1 TaxID=944289 RepID=A0A0D0CV96_9AGAR|nr:hypothetical protein GYMLUDRAFT_60002 [Collybiopsis luxurians FD-317 M1]
MALPYPLIPSHSSSLLLSHTPTKSSSIPSLPPPTDLDEEQFVVDALVLPTAREITHPPSSPPPPRLATRPRRSTARYSSPIRPEELESDPQLSEQSSNQPKVPVSPRKTVTLVPYTPDPPTFVEESKPRSPSRIVAPATAAAKSRELGSLSPSSVTILTSLLPPPAPPPSPLREVPEPDSAEAETSHVAPPIRFASPIRKSSPKKFILHPAAPDHPNTTPARRIPIQDAIANGQISPDKGFKQLSGGRFPLASSRHLPIQSPARRVFVQDDSISSPSKKMLGSPVRSRSVEPTPSQPLQLKKRSESVEPASSGNSGKVAGRPSPFSRPDFASTRTLHPTIPEEGPSTISGGSQTLSIAPVKNSRLRQPTSKIPRIGSKPYARPTASTNLKSPEKPLAMKKVGSSSSSSMKPKSLTSSSQSQGPSSIPVPSPAKQKTTVPSTPTSLKRKRGPEGSSPTKLTPIVLLPAPKRPASQPASPVKKPSIPQLRMVSDKDGVLPNRSNAIPSASQAKQVPAVPPTSIHRPLPKMRWVSDSDGILPDRSVVSPQEASPPQLVTDNDDTNPEHSVDSQIDSPPPKEELPIPPISTIEQAAGVPSSPIQEEAEEELPSSDPLSDNSAPAQPLITFPIESSEFTFRRTTRSSRNGNTNAAPKSSRPPPARRKNLPAFPDTGPFSGMTALALRTLTDSNTTRNKEYLTALLQTEVVRREGARPESPGMIIKSISQKAKEDMTKDRNARAERRAKRENRGKGVDENGFSEDDDGEEERTESGLDNSPSNRKHAWGPGDEEDYESPVRPMKRLRLNDDDGPAEDFDDKKRVKWDRGLFQQIYLDDIKPRTTHSRITHSGIKGCLAPTSKALRLDTLGNLPNADSPLNDLMKENVVVKKFVYDSDVVEPLPAPPPPVKTRSKSKKSKL